MLGNSSAEVAAERTAVMALSVLKMGSSASTRPMRSNAAMAMLAPHFLIAPQKRFVHRNQCPATAPIAHFALDALWHRLTLSTR